MSKPAKQNQRGSRGRGQTFAKKNAVEIPIVDVQMKDTDEASETNTDNKTVEKIPIVDAQMKDSDKASETNTDNKTVEEIPIVSSTQVKDTVTADAQEEENQNTSKKRKYHDSTQPSLPPAKKVKVEYILDPRKVVLGKLELTIDDESIREVFEKVGPIVSFTRRKDEDGNFNGFAELEFQSAELAEKALELRWTKIGTKRISVGKVFTAKKTESEQTNVGGDGGTTPVKTTPEGTTLGGTTPGGTSPGGGTTPGKTPGGTPRGTPSTSGKTTPKKTIIPRKSSEGKNASFRSDKSFNSGLGSSNGSSATFSKPPKANAVFLSNLFKQITDAKIREIFSEYGKIVDLRRVEKDGVFQGSVFIQYDEESAAEKAKRHSGSAVAGIPVQVDYALAKTTKTITFEEKKTFTIVD